MKDNGGYAHEEGDQPDFSTIHLEEIEAAVSEKKKRIPRRVLHFCDGILEEYSTDEDEAEEVAPPQPVVDPRTLKWRPWIWNRIATTSTKTVSAIDFCGEKLAGFFGILDSRYQYAIDEYHKNKKEEEEERKASEHEMEVMRLRELAQFDNIQAGDTSTSVQVISIGNPPISLPVKVDPLPVNEQI